MEDGPTKVIFLFLQVHWFFFFCSYEQKENFFDEKIYWVLNLLYLELYNYKNVVFETNTILFREILNFRDTSMFSHNHNITKKIEANFLNRVLSQKFSYYHLLSNKVLTESLDIFNFIIWESLLKIQSACAFRPSF